VPLSEEELRLLEQMERALVAEDPKLASTMRGTRVHRQARRQMIGGALGFVAGVGLLMTGVITKLVPVGILGFVVMLLCAYLALAAWRGGQASAAAETSKTPAEGGDETSLRMIQGGKRPRRSRTPKSHASMMERFEERWRRRREQGGQGRDY
jgi:UPF0716 family protein affecting phage T7 exclusion